MKTLPSPQMSNSLATVTAVQLRQAIAIKEQIEALETELATIFGAGPASVTTKAAPAGKRTMSAAGRARVAAAQRARWARQKGSAPQALEAPKPKRKISPEARQRMVAGAKARWAKNQARKAASAKA